jgi:predicted membrane protein
MDADFEYNISSWKPIVRYDASSFRSQLRIEQPRGVHGGSHVDYKWNLRFNDKMPLDVMMDLGAGEARMNLGSMNLRSVEINVGVGEVRVDLRGKPTRDYNVNINGGVGHATVYLPSDVGVIANAKGGIGDLTVRGLEKRGRQWINAAHENAPVTIHLDVKGGIGQIEIIAE